MAPNFKAYSTAGRKLADLHLKYETGPKYDIKPIAKFGDLKDYKKDTKISYPKIKQNNKLVPDKTRLKINGIIAFENLPDVQYKVNGRTPLEWMIDRYKRTIDKDSGIINDPTINMTEQKTIDMVQRLIYVGVESDKIINELSKLEFEPKDWNPEPVTNTFSDHDAITVLAQFIKDVESNPDNTSSTVQQYQYTLHSIIERSKIIKEPGQRIPIPLDVQYNGYLIDEIQLDPNGIWRIITKKSNRFVK